MKSFANFLDKKYKAEEKAKIIDQLQKMGIFKSLEKVINQFFRSYEKCTIAETQSHGRNFLRRYISITLGCYKSKFSNSCNETNTGRALQLGAEIYCSILEDCSGKNAEKFNILLQTVDFISQDFCKDDLSLIIIRFMYYFFSGSASQKKRKKKVVDPNDKSFANYFHWVDYLIDKLKRKTLKEFIKAVRAIFEGIKPEMNIYKLFSPPNSNYKITLKSELLCAFLVLIWELEKCGRITLDNNPGLFAFLDYRLKSPTDEDFTGSGFMRQIKYNATKSKKKLEKIYKLIGGLLNEFGVGRTLYIGQ